MDEQTSKPQFLRDGDRMHAESPPFHHRSMRTYFRRSAPSSRAWNRSIGPSTDIRASIALLAAHLTERPATERHFALSTPDQSGTKNEPERPRGHVQAAQQMKLH